MPKYRDPEPPGPHDYPDRGCRYHTQCLSCPFPVCLIELEWGHRQAYLKTTEPPSPPKPTPERRVDGWTKGGYLTETQFAVLSVLLEADRPLPQYLLAKRALGDESMVVRPHVGNLRKRLAPYGLDSAIARERGGYFWKEPA